MAVFPQDSLPLTLPPRAMVERLVREQLRARIGLSMSGPTAGEARPLVVNVSARHCHLTQSAVESLFGPGHRLTPMKWLYQEGQYAAKETVTLIGPRSRVISNLRILGPCRDLNQVELAFTDAIALGFEVPVKMSGDIVDTPGCMLMGPQGYFQLDAGVIRAMPHVHMNPGDAARHGVKHLDRIRLRVGGPLAMTFENLVVRVDPAFKLEVHIDTDEGNACGLAEEPFCELLRL